MHPRYECVVVGAGISGLTVAREIAAKGQSVLVIDKARGVGGRLCTRRGEGGGLWDHGAQFLHAESAEFSEKLKEWERAKLIFEWAKGFPTLNRALPPARSCYAVKGGMTTLAKTLAGPLAIKLNSRVVDIAEEKERWQLKLESGERIEARKLVITSPLPQTLEMLRATSAAPVIASDLSHVEYYPCLALLLHLDGPSAVPPPGGLFIGQGPVVWISDNAQKGISNSPTLTIHASRDFSRAHFEAPEENVVATLHDSIRPYLGSKVLHQQWHRWRYAGVEKAAGRSFYQLAGHQPGLWLAGDAFGGASAEGAYLSGKAVAQSILS